MRQAIIDLESKRVVRVHEAWEPPAGHIVVNSENAEIGDVFIPDENGTGGKIVMGPERKQKEDDLAAHNAALAEIERQRAEAEKEAAKALANEKAALKDQLKEKKAKLDKAASDMRSLETLTPQQEVDLVVIENALDSINKQLKGL